MGVHFRAVKKIYTTSVICYDIIDLPDEIYVV